MEAINMIIEFENGMKYDDELLITNKDELLICRRNELVPENPQVQRTGIEGLLEYRLNENKRHPDCIYERYDETEHKYTGKSKTAEFFEVFTNLGIRNRVGFLFHRILSRGLSTLTYTILYYTILTYPYLGIHLVDFWYTIGIRLVYRRYTIGIRREKVCVYAGTVSVSSDEVVYLPILNENDKLFTKLPYESLCAQDSQIIL